MSIKEEWVHYGEGTGYFAVPAHAAGPLPGVLVIQEIGGVNRHIEEVTRRVAAAGYAALAPDLYSQNGQRPAALSATRISEAFAFGATQPPGAMFDPAAREAAMARLPEAERARIGETFGRMFSFARPGSTEGLMPLLRRAYTYLREERQESRGQRVGCVGYCMGGGLAALLACEEPQLSAAVVYYGMTPAEDKVRKVACPVLAFYGEKDQRVNAGIPAFQKGMEEAGAPYEHHVYPGAGHAFFNDDSPGYNVAAARDSFVRTLAFFNRTLAG